MTADLRLVADAAEGDADELAAQRPGDRLTERGLADTGRADQRHHRTRATAADDLETTLRTTGADREVLHDPILDVVEAVVIGVQHLARGGDVGRVGGLGVPGQLEDGVQPGADVAGLGALVAGPLELADLAKRRLADVVGQIRLLDTGSVVLRSVRLVLAELLADGVQLLAQQELALALLHALADVVGDLVVDLGLGEVGLGPLDQHGQARRHREFPATGASARHSATARSRPDRPASTDR